MTAASPHLTIELVNLCNLHCSYCVRDDEALHRSKAQYLAPELLRRILEEARAALGLEWVSFTGGEVTLHPRFGEILKVVGEVGLQCSFITNGWHFERVWPALREQRAVVRNVAFSLDGATAEAHDRWRGAGSLARVMKAFALCHFHQIPFIVKTVLRRDVVPQLEALALLTARLGAAELHFIHFLPTDAQFAAEHALTLKEQRRAEQEIATLGNIFKMSIGVDVGYYDLDPAPPCSVLRHQSANLDYRGRLTLCCNLAGFRGGAAESDVIADLTQTSFAEALPRLRDVATQQVARRQNALAGKPANAIELNIGSPCLFCLASFAKVPWQSASATPEKYL
ncbi:MAG: radical SAM protein [Acidobacteria bacterium]|nr:radical SAM protein [Acidobacteriota bacterium]